MRDCLFRKGLVLGILIIFISTTFATSINVNITKLSGDRDTEYWALLISTFDNFNNENIALVFDNIYNVLLDTPWWSADHIKVIQDEEATKRNIFQGLRWLDSMDDADDISLVYISTHGGHLNQDLFPYDEEDGFDEVLATYWSEDYPSTMIRDDELNFFLSRLDSQGVCLIVDSCHSGGFNDSPLWNKKSHNYGIGSTGEKKHSWFHWMEGFAEEVHGQGRVVVMACREDELATAYELTPAFIDGLRGFADKNMDGMVSAEETFFYAYPRCYQQHPTIYDNFVGELFLTKAYVSNPSTSGKDNDEVITVKKGMMNRLNGFTERPTKNSIVCGYITDAQTNEPIKSAFIELEWHGNGEMDWDHGFTNTSGFYSMKVAAGSVILYLSEDKYLLDESGWLEIGDNETLWVNISLIPRFPENSRICGYITDAQTNEPIKTWFWMLWRDGQRHFYYNRSTESDSNGFYSIDTSAGEAYFFFHSTSPYPQLMCHNKTYCINVGDNETLWFNFSMKRKNLSVKIRQPLKALYIGDKIVWPFLSAVIIGRITIEVDAKDYWSEIDRVEFYIDGVLKWTDTIAPYNWTWRVGGILKRKHTIQVIAYNNEGVTATDEIDVWKFL